MSTPALYDPADPSRSAVALVNHHLTWLKLGGLYLDFTKTPRDIPEGRGWCRAEPLPEVLWPAHAELAVVVHFFPDPLFRRNDNTGHLPPGAMQHWTERLDACADALADCGFVVEEWGIPRTPDLHSGADLVVYRLPAGRTPSPRTAEDLRHAHPPRPNFQTRRSTDIWPIEALLERADPPLFSRHEQQDTGALRTGRCIVRDVDEHLWPPGTQDCALVTWEPAPLYQRAPNQSTPPPGAYTHWLQGVTYLAQTLIGAGYQIRRRTRPSHPETDRDDTFLVYLPIPEGTDPPSTTSLIRPSTRPRWKAERPVA
ncbi:hypothetical protein [Streptomyces sp. NPDC017940]|uniref:hypothetical protein n=1 Tax=Streptomyces sp. NPDC017940 TaxID=3365017 RepID=UPI0037A1D96F